MMMGILLFLLLFFKSFSLQLLTALKTAAVRVFRLQHWSYCLWVLLQKKTNPYLRKLDIKQVIQMVRT